MSLAVPCNKLMPSFLSLLPPEDAFDGAAEGKPCNVYCFKVPIKDSLAPILQRERFVDSKAITIT